MFFAKNRKTGQLSHGHKDFVTVSRSVNDLNRGANKMLYVIVSTKTYRIMLEFKAQSQICYVNAESEQKAIEIALAPHPSRCQPQRAHSMGIASNHMTPDLCQDSAIYEV